jgi:hypothetical protein
MVMSNPSGHFARYVLQLFVLRRSAMYVKPEVTRYCGTELLDLMGPVETGYCDIPDTLVECGPATISIPLCMENPDFIYFETQGGETYDGTIGINDPEVTVKDGVATIRTDEACIAPAGTYTVDFGVGIGNPEEPDDYCISCTQRIEILPNGDGGGE